MSSQKGRMECKAPAGPFFTTLTLISLVGSVGCIVSWTTSGNASQGVSGMPWANYQRHSMGRMNARCERSTTQTGNLLDGSSYVSRWFPVRLELKNWRHFSHLISKRDRSQSFGRIGALKIL